MSNILFYANKYWELHWLYNVIKKMNGVVCSPDDETVELCHQYDIQTVDKEDYKGNWQIVVTCVFHLSPNKEVIDYFIKTGGKSVLLQHAWDVDIHLTDHFWNLDLHNFSYYCVGSNTDYEAMKRKFGEDKIVFTGIPRLDDVEAVRKSRSNLKQIRKEVGLDKYYLAMLTDPNVHGSIVDEFYKKINDISPIRVAHKIHPGGNLQATKDALAEQGYSNLTVLDDDRVDRLKTYKLMKASSGVVCVESFMSVEASLLGVPVIPFGLKEINPDFYNREENKIPIKRFPKDMTSTLKEPVFDDAQKKLADDYKFDGKNTDRVVNFLQSL